MGYTNYQMSIPSPINWPEHDLRGQRLSDIISCGWQLRVSPASV